MSSPKWLCPQKESHLPPAIPRDSPGSVNESDPGSFLITASVLGFPGGSVGKESARSAGGPCSIPGLGRFPGERNSNPLHYPCLENYLDSGAWWATVRGSQRVRHNWVTLSDHFLLGECEILCISFKNGIFVFYNPPVLPFVSPTGLQNQTSWGFFFCLRDS